MQKKEARYSKDKRGIYHHGLYAQFDLHKIDGRSRLGRMIRALKERLKEFVGESSPATELLIERIIFKAVKLGEYEAACLNKGAEEKPADHYISLSNSFRNDLSLLNELAVKKMRSDEWEEELKKITQEIGKR